MSKRDNKNIFQPSKEPIPELIDYNKSSFLSFLKSKKIILFSGGFILLLVVFIIYLSLKPAKKEEIKLEEQVNTNQIEEMPATRLPTTEEIKKEESKIFDETIKAEKLNFFDYYKKPEEKIEITLPHYNLPINIKTEVINYYDLSRKIDLTSVIDQLNQNGFAIIDNQFANEGNDFISSFKSLYQREIPLLVTNDFLIYYFQNTLKETFKNIETNVFYPALWQMSKKLFDKAYYRYLARSREVGLVNDPLLEGQRLAVLYWAVTLELLRPKEAQLESGQFDKYGIFDRNSIFEVPAEFTEQVNKEISLIKEAAKIVDSPVLLYKQDYKKFKIPEEYKTNEPLKNFYLALRWLNTIFPLYYQDKNCPECLLDKPDWLINFIAANYIADDIAKDQSLKNLWAKIYKVISFFKGLRSDLTYLDYHDALEKIFGENYIIEDIFSNLNQETINKIQTFLIKNYNFLPFEGAYDRKELKDRPFLGMRLLQESFWPNDYIFAQLSRPLVKRYTGKLSFEQLKQSSNVTYCSPAILERCLGFSRDIINLVYPLSPADDYFIENTNYENYQNQVNFLKDQLKKLAPYRFYANIYWESLKWMEEVLKLNKSKHPIFMQRPSWQTRELEMILGSWVNMQLPSDELNFDEEKALLKPSEIILYNFIEPNQNLTAELIAHLNMIKEMLVNLGVIGGSPDDQAYKKLTFTLQFLQTIHNSLKKELTSESLTYGEQKEILETIQKLSLGKTIDKSINFNFKFDGQEGGLIESINGVKLLLVIYKKDDKLIMAVGPIFNYQELRR